MVLIKKHKLDLYNEIISKNNYNDSQKREIILGLNENLNVELYLNPKLNRKQMHVLTNGLFQKLDVTCYNILVFNYKKFNEIRFGL